ncbi:hypothetical protein CAF53_11010 [Sphingobium sp. LB126]|uniref:DUF3617 domain-containing protein n=1 Tax=Sphingobium sp. LB126 TaxID=1983755 RepID=UPI000C2099C6|nr:DUF3617 family protein [Sphingobium sp. LB126]PJG48705.1 hypothetical protein CAF53_11010 [Sphingobium sp. LB126]
MAGSAAWGMLMLVGCAPRQDDPSNPPRLGQWHDRTILTGVRLNDRALKDEEIPSELRGVIDGFNKEKSVCGEPRLREKSEIQAMLDEKFDDCAMETFDADGSTLSALARCRPHDTGQDIQMTVRVDGRTGAEHLLLDVDGIARLTEKTGGNYVVVVSGRREITRIGDC